MGYKVDKIFEDCACLGKVHSKEQYKVNSDKFKEERYPELETLVKAQDVEAECRQFCEDVFMTFKKFGKVRGTDRMNLNYFMIFYVFPTILSEEGDKAAEICETLKNTWNCPIIIYTRPKYSNTHYEEMVKKTYDVVKKWNIGLIDLWTDADMTPAKTGYMKDAIHPTRLGYDNLWTPKFEAYIAEYLRK